MKSNYPDKYCVNCNQVTERYSKGNCKKCVAIRNKSNNKIRSNVTSEMTKVIEDVYPIKFNKNLYKEFTIETAIYNKLVIYFLINNDSLVYVGKSNSNVLSRIQSHISDKIFNQVRYISVSTQKALDEYEIKYITKYKPKFNKMLYYLDGKHKILDLKTLNTYDWSIQDLIENVGCSINAARGLLSGNRNKIYNRYSLYKNKKKSNIYKNILDTNTNIIKRYSLITFAEEVGKNQNNVWNFFNGITKSYQKKRYVLVKSKVDEIIEMP